MVISWPGRGSLGISSNSNETQSGQGSGWKIRPIGDNQLAHLGREKYSQCSILVMSHLEFILCDQGGGSVLQYAFSNLRHLQDLPLP